MTQKILIDGWDFSPDQILQPGEVARMFGVDPKTVTRWARANHLTNIRTPAGHRRYSRQQVEAIMRGEATP
jgi:predicted site-specific integrase-resolvase